MPRNTNRYRTAADRAQRRSDSAGRKAGIKQTRVWRLLDSAVGRIRRPRAGREIVVIATLGLAAVIGLSCLGGAFLLYRNDHDWASVATVNGTSIDRERLRGRLAVLKLLGQERTKNISSAFAAGAITSDQAAALESAAAAGTSVEAARQSLIADELLHQLASGLGVSTSASSDPWAEAATFASTDVAHRVRYIRFGLPASIAQAPSAPSDGVTPSPSPTSSATPTASPAPASSPVPSTDASPWPAAGASNVGAAEERVKSELAANTSAASIVNSLHATGWQVIGEDVTVSSDGIPSDSSLDLDATIAADTLTAKPGTLVGPTTDEHGRVSLALALATQGSTVVRQRIQDDAGTAKVDVSAVQSWANGQALQRAVKQRLVSGWSSGTNEAQFRQAVIGPAPDSSGTAGPWVELSMLSLNRLAGLSWSSISGAPAGMQLDGPSLAKELMAQSETQRVGLFGALVQAANAAPGANQTNTSGEIGFQNQSGLTPSLGAAAFASSTRSFDVIGPITTSAGPELFLVEARYSGTLDARSEAALSQVRVDPSPNVATYTEQFSPDDVALAVNDTWRAEPEFASTEAAHSALFDTQIGSLSDPFVLDGKLVVAVVDKRQTAVPDARTLDRLSIDGFTVWYSGQYKKAKITETTNPLPELMPSASPTSSAAPVLPSTPVLDTPQLPAVPGQPAATPGPTDAMGLPVLP